MLGWGLTSRERLATALTAVGVAIVLLGTTVPYFGYQGLRTVGPGIAVLGGCSIGCGLVTGRRPVVLAGVIIGAVAIALLGLRIADRPHLPPDLLTYFGHAWSRGAVVVCVIGAVLVTAAGVIAATTPRLGSASDHGLGPAESPDRGLPARREAIIAAWRSTWTSRLLVFAAGIVTVLQSAPQTVSVGLAQSRPFGQLGTLLTAPASAWDANYYLTIARYGYAVEPSNAVFFPLYPTLIRLGGWSNKSAFITGLVISVLALLGALYLLYRLVELDCDPATARLAVLLTAFFPIGVFFSAIYTESLFLLLSVAAFYAARRGRWARAGMCGMLAALTRPTGILLIVPLAVIYLWNSPTAGSAPDSLGLAWGARLGARRRIQADALFLLLIPAGLLAYLAYSGHHGDWLAPLHDEHTYWHLVSGPLRGLIDGVHAAVRSVEQIVSGPASHDLPAQPSNPLLTPDKLAAENLTDFAFLLLGIIATIGALRRLPPAYGVYVLVTLLAVTSNTNTYQPLLSLPRSLMVCFPCEVWLALWAQRCPTRWPIVLAASAGLLALFAGEFSIWTWVA